MNRWSENSKVAKGVRVLVLALALGSIAGCVQVERIIYLNRDGSGTLTEKIRFDEELFAMARSSKKFGDLSVYLTEAHTKKRATVFGAVSLVKQNVETVDGKIRAVENIFSFKDLNRVTLPALPSRNANWPQQKVSFVLQKPVSVSKHYYPINALVHVLPLTARYAPPAQGTPAKANPNSPAGREKLRKLLPVIRAMLKGFRLSHKITAFGPVGEMSRTNVLFNLGSEDLKDDETLLKLIEWNRFPDEFFGHKGRLGRGGGRIMNQDRRLQVQLESPPSQVKPLDPLKGSARKAPADKPAFKKTEKKKDRKKKERKRKQ